MARLPQGRFPTKGAIEVPWRPGLAHCLVPEGVHSPHEAVSRAEVVQSFGEEAVQLAEQEGVRLFVEAPHLTAPCSPLQFVDHKTKEGDRIKLQAQELLPADYFERPPWQSNKIGHTHRNVTRQAGWRKPARGEKAGEDGQAERFDKVKAHTMSPVAFSRTGTIVNRLFDPLQDLRQQKKVLAEKTHKADLRQGRRRGTYAPRQNQKKQLVSAPDVVVEDFAPELRDYLARGQAWIERQATEAHVDIMDALKVPGEAQEKTRVVITDHVELVEASRVPDPAGKRPLSARSILKRSTAVTTEVPLQPDESDSGVASIATNLSNWWEDPSARTPMHKSCAGRLSTACAFAEELGHASLAARPSVLTQPSSGHRGPSAPARGGARYTVTGSPLGRRGPEAVGPGFKVCPTMQSPTCSCCRQDDQSAEDRPASARVASAKAALRERQF